jgi:ureidoglycolate hydrolase
VLIVQALVAIEAVQRRSRPEGVAVWQSAERMQIMIMPGSGEDHDQFDLRLICPRGRGAEKPLEPRLASNYPEVSDLSISPRLLEIRSCIVQDYEPLVDYDQWRVAGICSSEHNRADRVKSVERHNETDEVFLLLAGRAFLVIGEGDLNVEAFHAVAMEPLTLYNVKRGVWHSCVLDPDSVVLVVENRDTSRANSDYLELPPELCQQLPDICKQID